MKKPFPASRPLSKDFPIAFIYDDLGYEGAVNRVQDGDAIGFTVELESEDKTIAVTLRLTPAANALEDWDMVLGNGDFADSRFDKDFLQVLSDTIAKSDPADPQHFIPF